MHESVKDTLLQSVVRGYFQYSSAWKVARSTILGARSSSLRRSFIVLSVYLLSYSSWRVARDQSRCGPSERGRAMGTCPRGRPVRGHKWNKCGKPHALKRESAHARPFAMICGYIDSAHCRELILCSHDRRLALTPLERAGMNCGLLRVFRLTTEVVLNALPLLLLGVRSLEVELESGVSRGCPGETSIPSAPCTLAASRAALARRPKASRHDLQGAQLCH